MPRFAPGQTLLIDADDTLWENNIYFERAIAAFISFLDHHEYTPHEVRQTLNGVERETILAHGYYFKEVLNPKLDIILLKFPEARRKMMRSKAYDLIFPAPLPRSKIDDLNSFISNSADLLKDPTNESKSTIEKCNRQLADITRDLPATQRREMRKKVSCTIFKLTQIKLEDIENSTTTSDQRLNC